MSIIFRIRTFNAGTKCDILRMWGGDGTDAEDRNMRYVQEKAVWGTKCLRKL